MRLRAAQRPGRRSELLLCATVAITLCVAVNASAGGCAVSATPVNFGFVSALSVPPAFTVGMLTYTCIGPLPAGLKIMLLRGSKGSARERLLKAAHGGEVAYFLSLDPAGTTIWGDGSGGTSVFYDPSPASGRTVTLRVFAHLIPTRIAEPNGIYSDEVAVKANF
jgi:spore coat protein U domain-containing protein, fimbrial subunit CupE1/2/3/6